MVRLKYLRLKKIPMNYVKCHILDFFFLSQQLFHCRQIETCAHALSSLCSVFEQANIIRRRCDHGSLLPIGQECTAMDLCRISDEIDQYPFYSRVAGFHVRN